ncbi:hypothetical protein FRC01_002967, partial [Tulasnella sp. 417]
FSGTSTGMTDEESAKRDVQDEMLHSRDTINSNSEATKNRGEFDLDHSDSDSELKERSEAAARHARRNSEPVLTSPARYSGNPFGRR